MTAKDIRGALRDAAEGTAAILFVIAPIAAGITAWTSDRTMVLLLPMVVLPLLGWLTAGLLTFRDGPVMALPRWIG